MSSSRPSPLQGEMKMSMFKNLGRYGAAIKHAHNRNKSDPGAEQPAVRNPEGHRLARVAAQ